jgi:hypothetical protein
MRNYHKTIEKEAYQLWLKAGKPEGLSDFFWHLAKDIVKLKKRVAEAESDCDSARRDSFRNNQHYINDY